MKPSGFLFLTGLACAAGLRAADATSPVDYTQRNAPFVPAGTVKPAKRTPELAENVQEKRVTPSVMPKPAAVVGERRAAIDVAEAGEKNVREKTLRTPDVRENVRSGFDHQRATVSTAKDAQKPALVAKYQDSLAAASATNMARFPAMEEGTKIKLNRFVFRKNGDEPAAPVVGAAVTPAAGGAAVRP